MAAHMGGAIAGLIVEFVFCWPCLCRGFLCPISAEAVTHGAEMRNGNN